MKYALVVGILAVIGGFSLTKQTIDPSKELVDNLSIDMDPVNLNSIDEVNQYFDTATKVVDVMKETAEYAEFADLAEGLGALGPEMAIVGGVIAIFASLFGGPS